MRKLVFFLVPILFILGCVAPSCPESCDDSNSCTTDWCNETSNYVCVHDAMADCCGNGICEESSAETFSTCSADCPNCDDSDVCTTDSFNYDTQACGHATITLTPVFEDDMESGIDKWNESFTTDVWSIGEEDGNHVLQGITPEGNESARIVFAKGVGESMGNYSLSGRFKVVNGSLFLLLKFGSVKSSYFIVLVPNTTMMKAIESQQAPSLVADSSVTIERNIWHPFKIVAIGNRILLFVDDTEIIDYTDEEDPHITGLWGMHVAQVWFGSEGYYCASYLDDISISEVDETNYLC